MLNLVQIQDKLKDMPTQAIMAYANGQNPMVPPYLALGELNRRKQMEQSAMSEQARQGGEPPTIKQATEEQLGLMNLQKQRAMAGQQNMGRAMANALSPVPAGVGEEPVQMAGGGLARLPSNIRQFANGGIVAFQSGGNPDQEMQQFDQAAALYEAEREARKAKEDQQLSGKIDATALLRKLVEQAQKGTTIEDTAAQIKRSKELAGVSEDPYAESRKEREGLLALRKEQAARQPMKELREYLLGMSETKPGYGLGMALGSGEKRRGAEEDRFNTLQDQQRSQEIQWMRADEKERDAIARGDAKTILEAQQEKDKLSYNIAKLSTEKEQLAYQKFMMAVNGDPYLRQLEERRKKAYVQPGSAEDREFDRQMNERKAVLAKEAGFDYRTVPYENPVTPPPPKEKKGFFNFGKDDKKEDSSKASYDTGIPSGLPKGTTVAGRTPDGKVVYLTPDGKKVTEK